MVFQHVGITYFTTFSNLFQVVSKLACGCFRAPIRWFQIGAEMGTGLAIISQGLNKISICVMDMYKENEEKHSAYGARRLR